MSSPRVKVWNQNCRIDLIALSHYKSHSEYYAVDAHERTIKHEVPKMLILSMQQNEWSSCVCLVFL